MILKKQHSVIRTHDLQVRRYAVTYVSNILKKKEKIIKMYLILLIISIGKTSRYGFFPMLPYVSVKNGIINLHIKIRYI